MGQYSGVIEAVSEKESKHPRFGTSYKIGVKIDGTWYGAFFKQSAAKLGLEEGATVSFKTVMNGDYENIEPKSLSVDEAAPAQEAGDDAAPAKAAGGKKPWAGEKGTKIGHAINNAVNIAAATGEAGNLKAIHAYACDILALSVVLESQYDRILGSAAERVKAKTGTPATTPSPDPKEQPEPPVEKAKPEPKKPAAAKPAKAAPVKAPDPAEDNHGFDDDIPF
jgi:hypothetical protein